MDPTRPKNLRSETYTSDEDDTDDPNAIHALTDHDRTVLQEDEQQERLLSRSVAHSGRSETNNEKSLDQGRRARRNGRLRLRKAKRTEKGDAYKEGKLMYELEEGGSRDDLSSSTSSSTEFDTLKDQFPQSTTVSAAILTASNFHLTSALALANSTDSWNHGCDHSHFPPSHLRII